MHCLYFIAWQNCPQSSRELLLSWHIAFVAVLCQNHSREDIRLLTRYHFTRAFLTRPLCLEQKKNPHLIPPKARKMKSTQYQHKKIGIGKLCWSKRQVNTEQKPIKNAKTIGKKRGQISSTSHRNKRMLRKTTKLRAISLCEVRCWLDKQNVNCYSHENTLSALNSKTSREDGNLFSMSCLKRSLPPSNFINSRPWEFAQLKCKRIYTFYLPILLY